jgi:hypothetical protein
MRKIDATGVYLSVTLQQGNAHPAIPLLPERV